MNICVLFLERKKIEIISISFFFLCLFYPTPAYAIINPFMFFSVATIVFHFILGLIIFLPFWYFHSKFFYASLSPIVKNITFYSLLLLVVLYAITLPDRIVDIPPTLHSLDYAKTCQPLGRFAKKIKLRSNDILIDPRTPNQFDLYHVKGSCNLDPQLLLSDPALRHELESSSGTIYVVSETTMTNTDFYSSLVRKGFSTNKWKILESGYFFYRLSYDRGFSPSIINKAMDGKEAYKRRSKNIPNTWIPFFNSNLNYNDRLIFSSDKNSIWQDVFMRGGPSYARGWHASILGNHPSWRQRSVSFLLDEKYSDVVRIFVEDFSYKLMEPPPYVDLLGPTFKTGRSNSSVEHIEKLARQDIKKSIFICDHALTCTAAEGFASDLLLKNREVFGYILIDQSILYMKEYRVSFLLSFLTYPGTEWIVFVFFLFLSFATYSGIIFICRKLRNLSHRKRFFSFLESYLWAFLPFIGIFSGVATQFICFNIPEFLFTQLDVYIHDTARLGMWVPSLIAPLVIVSVALMIFHQRSREKSVFSLIVYWFIVALASYTSLFFSFFMQDITIFGGISIIVMTMLPPCVRKLSPFLKVVDIKSKVKKFPVLLPLTFARYISFSGQKTQWLAKCLSYGLFVSDGFIFLTTIQSFDQLLKSEQGRRSVKKILKPVLRVMKSGKIIVRSSAPEEDKKARLQAGLYKSLLNVEQSEILDSLQTVLESYREKGISESEPVAVLLQAQVQGDYSGVCSREDSAHGGALLIEANEGDNISITSGKGAQLWFRIGRFSRKIVSGDTLPKDFRINSLTFIHTVLEKIFKQPLNTEWSMVGKKVYIHQVRPIPKSEKDEQPNHAVMALDILEQDLLKSRYKRKHVVLETSELPDYQYGASVATKELIADVYEFGIGSKGIGGKIYQWFSLLGPNPKIVEFGHGLYLNRISTHPFAFIVFAPILTLKNLEMRILFSGKIRAIESNIEEWKKSIEPYALKKTKENLEAFEIVEIIHQIRDLLVKKATRNLFDALVLVNVFKGKKEQDIQDEFLLYMSNPDKSREEDAKYAYRSSREYSLDTPRFGEISQISKIAFEMYFSSKNDLLYDRSKSSSEIAQMAVIKARDGLSLGVALLRFFYLELAQKLSLLGGQIFSASLDELDALVHEKTEMEDLVEEEKVQDLPVNFTVKMLEQWAAGETVDKGESKSFWVSGEGSYRGKVVDKKDKVKTDQEIKMIWVVEHPTVDDASMIPNDHILISFGGNRLCHAAIVLRERGISAIFQADSYREILQKSQIVEIDSQAKIELSEPKVIDSEK